MISIVTPSFRQIDWLRLATASVADQAGVEVEHIVQDAQTPGVEDFFASSIEPLQSPNYRAKLFVEKDAGMYDAVNRGLRRSQGEICAYLNCDEQYLPGSLAKVAHFFARNPSIDMLFGDAILTDETGRPISYRRSIRPTMRHIRHSHLNTLSCAMFFRRSVIERGFEFDPRWKDIGDAVWVETLLRHGIRMRTIREPLAVFAFTGANRSSNAFAQSETVNRRKAGAMRHRLASLFVVPEHRVKKLLAGAYRARDVAISIYTLDSPQQRRILRQRRVGFGWPK